MKAYLAQTLITIKLTFRDKMVLFFNYAFPLIFFFMFGSLNNAERGGAAVQVLTMVLTIGILGTGFFGAGIRAVQEREQNILRRFKVAPITAGPMLFSSLVTGLINYLPGALGMVLLSHFMYGMPFPRRWPSLFLFIGLGVIAFRAMGLIVASVVNSMQESQILVQLLYIPMLMLSGATIPLSILPRWLQIFAQFLPATYLITGMQGILGSGETFWQNRWSAAALVITTILGLFISLKLFRWEKEEKLPAASKLWILAVLAPFLIAGIYQARTNENVVRAKILERQQRRARAFLIRNVRIFVGNGKIIESGGVLVKAGKIQQVYQSSVPDPKELKADLIEGSGQTLMPGLIDVHVHLIAPGGVPESQSGVNPEINIPRELAAYLYSGITAVGSVGDPLSLVKKFAQQVSSGEREGAEVFACGPVFTTAGGEGTEYFKMLPENIRKTAEAQTVRTPPTAQEARRQVDALKQAGADGIFAFLDAGRSGRVFNRMDPAVLHAVVEEARLQGLPSVIHTGAARDVEDALTAGTNGIENGSARDPLGNEVFAGMKRRSVVYDPMLTALEATTEFASGETGMLDRALLQQVGPASLLASTKAFVQSPQSQPMRALLQGSSSPGVAQRNLLDAWQAGVALVTGSDAGQLLVIHGPTIQRELQLWVEAGIPTSVALQAATYNSARLLRADHRIGLIQNGYDASMVLLSGDPVKDIHATENIQSVFFKGERVDRSELFEPER